MRFSLTETISHPVKFSSVLSSSPLNTIKSISFVSPADSYRLISSMNSGKEGKNIILLVNSSDTLPSLDILPSLTSGGRFP